MGPPSPEDGAGHELDLVSIGGGPAGQKAAIQAAKLGYRAAVIERNQVGGVCVMTGTIPSKTLREAVLHLTGLPQRGIYGQSYRVKEEITVDDLRVRSREVVAREVDVIRDQLARNRVSIFGGSARFLDPHTLSVADASGGEETVAARVVVVATGSRPVRPSTVAFDGRAIFDSDSLLEIDRIPGSLAVVGAGVIGVEYASLFAALGAKVTVIDKRRRLLDFCDDEIAEGLQHHLRDLGVAFRLGEEVTSVESLDEGPWSGWPAGSASRRRRSCTRPDGRGPPRASASRMRGSRPTPRAASRWGRASGRPWSTSTPWAT